MGRRGSTETATGVLLAFLRQRTWRQADLARHLGVARKTLVRCLTDLQEAGMRLEREVEAPQVYWSVPKSWFPGAILLRQGDVQDLVRVLQRAPQSQKRDKLLRSVTDFAAERSPLRDDGRAGAVRSAIVTRNLSSEEETWLSVMQAAVEERRVVLVRYFTASRGDLAERHLSVQRIFVEKRKLVAHCHRDQRLKWFSLDRILAARVDELAEYVEHEDARVDTYVQQSVDGYHSGSEPVRCDFWVSDPDARWVKEQLPLGCDVSSHEGGLVFSATTAGLLPLARFIVGLGASARVLTPELSDLVIELAEGALGRNAVENRRLVTPPEQTSGAHIKAAK